MYMYGETSINPGNDCTVDVSMCVSAKAVSAI